MKASIDKVIQSIANDSSAFLELKSLYQYVREREGDVLNINKIQIMFPRLRSEKIREYLFLLEKASLITRIDKIDISNGKTIRGYRYLVKHSIKSRLDLRIMHSLLDNGFSIFSGLYKKKILPIIAKKNGVVLAYFYESIYTITQIAKIPFPGTKCLIVKNEKIINFSSIKCLYEEEVLIFSKTKAQIKIEQ